MSDDRSRGSLAGSAVRSGLIEEPPEDDASRHELAQRFPDFLRWIDSDPDRAWAGYYAFAWKLLRVYPPRQFQGLSRETREDIAMKMVVAARENDFQALRKYRDEGKPFAVYVRRIANNVALDVHRRNTSAARHQKHIRQPRAHSVEAVYESEEVLSLVRQCMATLNDRCQMMLTAAAEGYRPREIAVLLGLPPGSGTKISESLRVCRRSLKTCLRSRGFDTEIDGMKETR